MQIVLSYVFVIIWEHCVSKYWMWLNNNLCTEFFSYILNDFLTLFRIIMILIITYDASLQVLFYCELCFIFVLFFVFVLQICRTVGPSLAASLEPLSHGSCVASLKAHSMV